MCRMGCLGLVLLLTVVQVCAGDDPYAVRARFQEAHPRAGLYEQGGLTTRVCGPALSSGADPQESAAAFVRDWAHLFGVDAADLSPGNQFNDVRTQPVMLDQRTGDYRFTLVYYVQHVGGVPVYGAELRLLVRNTLDCPLVLAASSLRPLGDFTVASGAVATDPGARGCAAARGLVPDLADFGPSEYVVWAGMGDATVEPTLAVTFVADNGRAARGDYAKWRFVADAVTGEILHRENLIQRVDIVGSVSACATPGIPPAAARCNSHVGLAMPEARVNVGTNIVYADLDGNFTIPHEGWDPVAVVSAVRGRWFRVFNQAGPDSLLTAYVYPPGPADFLHNSSGAEFTTAEVNAYIQANAVRNFVLEWDHLYPTIHEQEEFPLNVNLDGYCGAYYDGTSLNFFKAIPGCENAAFSGIVHHEYGHHVIACGGSGQGAYGEGMADAIAVLLSDEPGMGYGFIPDIECDIALRSADNDAQYPCDGGDYDCGQVLSGSIWSTRTELAATNPDAYTDIIAPLTIGSILLHTGDEVTPQITIDFLTLDDDDGDISNGTPHCREICAGFGAHGLHCPEILCVRGDYDHDLDVDWFDFAELPACMSGPSEPPAGSACAAFDFEPDEDVDAADFGAFQRAFTGSLP